MNLTECLFSPQGKSILVFLLVTQLEIHGSVLSIANDSSSIVRDTICMVFFYEGCVIVSVMPRGIKVGSAYVGLFI